MFTDNATPVAFGQTQHPAGNLDVDESYPGNLQTLTIALPATTVGGTQSYLGMLTHHWAVQQC